MNDRRTIIAFTLFVSFSNRGRNSACLRQHDVDSTTPQ
jgi:hypothetical protein